MAKNIIFCFSGTGNSLDIARCIAEELTSTDIVMMRKEPVITDAREYDRVGFVFPCHAGGLPIGVEDFIAGIKVAPMAYTWAVCTYGAYMGSGLRTIDEYIRLNYWAGIPHINSCIWLVPPKMVMPPMKQEKAVEKAEEKAALIALDILEGKHTLTPPPRVLNSLESAAWKKLAPRKAALFTVDMEACSECGRCVSICPKGNVHMEEDGTVRIGTDCIGCLGCLQFCPKSAISMGEKVDKRERYHNPHVKAGELTGEIIRIG